MNRLAGEAGRCHAGATARFFSAQAEVSDELEFIPTFAVALSGCDLRCAFCITGEASWNARAGGTLDARNMARRAEQALGEGARSIMVLGGEPTIHLPTALEFVSLLPDSARLIWKTNAHAATPARELLDDLFDVYLADFKFGNDLCAQRLARVDDYGRVVRENLLWATGQRSELVVRHLLMPGHGECCWRPIAHWLAESLPGTKINLRTGFWPAWHAGRHAELWLPPSATEVERARAVARAWPPSHPMKHADPSPETGQVCEMLILPDGRIFVHNLTPAMARLLVALDPDDTAMRLRAGCATPEISPVPSLYEARFRHRD